MICILLAQSGAASPHSYPPSIRGFFDVLRSDLPSFLQNFAPFLGLVIVGAIWLHRVRSKITTPIAEKIKEVCEIYFGLTISILNFRRSVRDPWESYRNIGLLDGTEQCGVKMGFLIAEKDLPLFHLWEKIERIQRIFLLFTRVRTFTSLILVAILLLLGAESPVSNVDWKTSMKVIAYALIFIPHTALYWCSNELSGLEQEVARFKSVRCEISP